MGLVLALLMAVVVALALWRFGRIDKAGLQLIGAALFLALAGYVWQGRPQLPAQPPLSGTIGDRADSELASTREALLGRFDRASRWLIISESYQRRGDTQNAAGIIQSGLRQNPRDPDLWTGLGNALVAHADGMLTPASEMAFARAAELAPGHPGPRFYYGLALAQNGRFAEAEAIWRDIVEGAPEGAEYRQLVAERLALLEQLQAAIEAQGQTAPPQ